MALYLAAFDPSRDFIVARDFLCRGRNVRKGDPFDRNSVSTRMLRIFYETRAVAYADDDPAPKVRKARFATVTPMTAAEQRGPAVLPMTDEEKAAMVAGHNKIALIQMARDVGETDGESMTKAQLVNAIDRRRRGLADR